jgi:hypothetical protein
LSTLLLKDTKPLLLRTLTSLGVRISMSNPVAPRLMHMAEMVTLHVEESVDVVVVGLNKVEEEARDEAILDRIVDVGVLLEEVVALARLPMHELIPRHHLRSQDADFCPSFQGHEHSAVYHTPTMAS